jgi:hypothetical protein
MANISSYPLITPKAGDLILFTETYDASAVSPMSGNPTRATTLGEVAALSNAINLGYKSYTALLTQSGAVAPVPTVLQNKTAGTFVWTYTGVGQYKITATNVVMAADKTIVFLNNGSTSAIDPNLYWALDVGSNSITIRCNADSILASASFEIRVYS